MLATLVFHMPKYPGFWNLTCRDLAACLISFVQGVVFLVRVLQMNYFIAPVICGLYRLDACPDFKNCTLE